jgi:hypothetical protein
MKKEWKIKKNELTMKIYFFLLCWITKKKKIKKKHKMLIHFNLKKRFSLINNHFVVIFIYFLIFISSQLFAIYSWFLIILNLTIIQLFRLTSHLTKTLLSQTETFYEKIFKWIAINYFLLFFFNIRRCFLNVLVEFITETNNVVLHKKAKTMRILQFDLCVQTLLMNYWVIFWLQAFIL